MGSLLRSHAFLLPLQAALAHLFAGIGKLSHQFSGIGPKQQENQDNGQCKNENEAHDPAQHHPYRIGDQHAEQTAGAMGFLGKGLLKIGAEAFRGGHGLAGISLSEVEILRAQDSRHAAMITKDGKPSGTYRASMADAQQMEAMTAFAKRRAAQLAGDAYAGGIDDYPAVIG